MPIVAELLDPDGQVVRGMEDPAGGTFDAAGDFDDLLPLVASQDHGASCQVVGSVDPDAVLDVRSNQMDDLLMDIIAMAELATNPRARRGLDRLRVMAERCKQAQGTRIRFVGD